MRVLVVSPFALPHVGGIEILVDQEVRALAERGWNVVLVTSDPGHATPVPVYPPLVQVERIGASHFLEKTFHIFYPLFSPRLLWVLWREVGRCDVIHAHGFLFMCSVLALLIGRLRGRRCFLTEHLGAHPSHIWLTTFLARLVVTIVARISTRLATDLLAYSPAILKTLERLSGTDTKSHLLVKPVDRNLFFPPCQQQRVAAREKVGWTSSRKKVLFVGRLIPDKGIHLLLHAADPSHDLAYCGPGDPAILRSLVGRRVEYLAPRTQPELASLYHAADLLVLPSIREGGLPLVVLEALACGLKVVVGKYAGSEVYRGIPGLWFCELHSHSIRRAILSALGASPISLGDRDRYEHQGLFTSLERWSTTLCSLIAGGVGRRWDEAVGFLPPLEKELAFGGVSGHTLAEEQSGPGNVVTLPLSRRSPCSASTSRSTSPSPTSARRTTSR